MLLNSLDVVLQWLLLALTPILLVFSAIALAVGAGLLVSAAHTHRVCAYLDRWVSLRSQTRWVAVPRDTAPFIERHQRAIGILFVLAAIGSLIGLATRVDVGRLVAALGLDAPREVVTWFLDSAYWFLIIGNVAAIVIGVMLVQFPAAVRRLESRANHWHSFRRSSIGGDDMHRALDGLVVRFPRASGAVISVVALGIMINSVLPLRGLG